MVLSSISLGNRNGSVVIRTRLRAWRWTTRNRNLLISGRLWPTSPLVARGLADLVSLNMAAGIQCYVGNALCGEHWLTAGAA